MPTPPVPQDSGGGPELELIGEALKAKVEEVREATVARTVRFDQLLDPMTQDAFERIALTSTVAVARWICGEPLEVTIEAGRETWEIFAELAVHRAATLDQVTWRCFWWRDVMAETVRAIVAEHELSDEALASALNLLQISLEFSLVRMCECFETERRRTDEALAHREEELAFMATHDSLTGLPNRTLILDRAEQMLARSRRANSPVAALFIDLDNFKDINDTLGHGMGDELLKAVAARLDFVTREADALGRLGGDEFVVISEELSLDVAPELVAERMLEALTPPFELGPEGETRVNVSASIGIAIAEESTAEELLRNADIAMYRAKWDGSGRYAVFEAGMQETVQNRVELEMDLRTAVEREEFFLAYQPTIDLDSMAPTGVEALLRWRHPERGVMQPDSFIPILEESGLIVEIGRWVLGEACRQGAAWRDAGHPIGMSVNVSARQLDDEQIVTDIEEALAASGLEASALTVEVTETTLMRDVEETVRLLARVKAARRADRDRRLRHRLLLARPPPPLPGRRVEDRPLLRHRDARKPRGSDADPHPRAARQGALDRDPGRGDRGARRALAAEGRGLRQRSGLPLRPPPRRRGDRSLPRRARPADAGTACRLERSGRGAQDDPRLGAGGARLAADRAHGAIEVVGVAARDPQLEVEAAGEEGHLTDRVELGDAPFELLRVGGGEEADVDEGVERAADLGRVDAGAVAGDHPGALEPADPVGGAVWAEADLASDRGEGGPSVYGEDAEDSVVDLVHGCGISGVAAAAL